MGIICLKTTENMKITTTCNTVPGSIADILTRKLGRTPTAAELRAEVKRILTSAR